MPTPPRSARPAVLRPDPEVWTVALTAAGGDARRLEVLDPRTVLVRNRPR